MSIIGSSQTLVLSSSITLLPLSNNTVTPRFYINSVATTNQNGAAFLNYRAAATAPSTMYLGLSRGTVVNTQGAVLSGDQLGQVVGEGNDGTHFQDSSVIQFKADANASTGAVPGNITLLTANASGSLTQAGVFDSAQSAVLGSAAMTTGATGGFIYIPSGAGAPTGTPKSYSGFTPVYVDTTDSQLWLYLGGAWKQPKTPAAAALVTWQ
jgi:hypothetical protein